MMLTDQELQSLRNLGNEAEVAADEIERLREGLRGMVTLLETLRTKGDSRYCYVESRAGQMVHVADAIDAASALLGPNVGVEPPERSARTTG